MKDKNCSSVEYHNVDYHNQKQDEDSCSSVERKAGYVCFHTCAHSYLTCAKYSLWSCVHGSVHGALVLLFIAVLIAACNLW